MRWDQDDMPWVKETRKRAKRASRNRTSLRTFNRTKKKRGYCWGCGVQRGKAQRWWGGLFLALSVVRCCWVLGIIGLGPEPRAPSIFL